MTSNQDLEEKIVIYKTEDNDIELSVKLEDETVWLDAHMIAKLFNVNRPAVVKHIGNIYISNELNKQSTCSILEQVAKDGKKRLMNHYNLDMIISIGYRVNSKRATQFRIWATNILRKYIVQGYALNQLRLEQNNQKYFELQNQLKVLSRVIENETFTIDQSKELIRIITDYARGLELIDQVDHESVTIPHSLSMKDTIGINYEDAIKDIGQLRISLNAHELFGNEKDNGFKSALQSIRQSFDGNDLYPSIEEKAANLLYLIIKNHPFTDGNKRIGSFMFVRFLDLNGILYLKDGAKIIEENALVAVALLLAQSESRQKDLMVKLVVNLIKGK